MRDWLAANGWDDVFVDLDPYKGLAPGERWQEALKAAAERCQAVVFLISPQWLASHWCRAEFLLAKQLGKRLFPVLIAEMAMEALPIEMTADHQAVDLVRDHHAWERIKEGLKRAGLDPETFAFAAGRRPYPGFEPLTEEDAAIFFGREAQVVRGLDRLRALSEAGVERLMVILGASGAGKSSFLRAGLWPRLKRDDRDFLPLSVIRPERGVLTGKFGLHATLEAAFAAPHVAAHPATAGLPRSRAAIGDLIAAEPSVLARMFAALRAVSGQALLLKERASPAIVVSIDQAEELFNEEGRAEAERFMELIAATLAQDRRALVILAIRSDTFPRLQSEPGFASVGKVPFDLPPLPVGSLGRVIEGPARVAKPALKLDPGLVEALLEDAAGQDSLPLLAFTLGRLYRDYGADGELTLAAYERLGRISGAVNAAVTEVLAEGARLGALPQQKGELEALLREAFIPHLARVNEAGLFARRVAAKAEIPVRAHPLIDLFVAARLLIGDRRPAAGGEVDVIEVAHEALLREWPALRGWLEADREFLIGKEQMAQDIAEWRAAGPKQKSDALLSGLKLTRAREWLHQRPAHDLTAAEREFIGLSIAHAEAAQRRKTRLRSAAAVVLLLVTGLAVWQWIDASRERDNANDRLILARNTSETLVSFIAKDLRRVQGIRNDTLLRLLDAARNSFERLASALRDDPNFQASRANMMSEFGDAYLKAEGLEKAADAYRESLAIFQTLAAVDRSAGAWQRGIADQIDNLGVVDQQKGDLTNALGQFNKALTIRKNIAAREPENFVSHRDLASSYYNLGEVLFAQNKSKEALESHNSALLSAQRAIAIAGDDNDVHLKLSLIHVSLGTIYRVLRRSEERLQSNLAALAIRKRLVEIDPDNSEWQRLLSWAYTWVAGSYEDQQNWPEALRNYRECLALRARLAKVDPGNRRAQYDLAWAHHYIANVLSAQEDLEEAAKHYRETYRIRVDLTQADASNSRWRKDLALSLMSLGDIADRQRKPEEAFQQFEAAVRLLEELTQRDPSNADWRGHLARAHNQAAKVLKVKGDLAGAQIRYEQALSIRRKLLAENPESLDAMTSIATSEFLVGDILQRRGDRAAALAHFKESRTLLVRVLDRDPNDAAARSKLGEVERAIGVLSQRREGE